MMLFSPDEDHLFVSSIVKNVPTVPLATFVYRVFFLCFVYFREEGSKHYPRTVSAWQ